MRKLSVWPVLGFVLIVSVLAYEFLGSRQIDTRYSGAYALPDGTFIYISSEGSERLRFRTLSGQSGVLWREGGRFRGGKGFAEREPAFQHITFHFDADGQPTGLVWEQSGTEPIRAPRIPLIEQNVTLASGDVRLSGKLVLPQGEGAKPAVLFIAGSDRPDGVQHAFEPYLYASRGFATLIFDRRGTGGSEGKPTQNVRVLATDALAALKWLRDQPHIDAGNVHIVGDGEGGWIAPMVAARDAKVRSVLECHGPLVSAFEVDRWRYVSALKTRGFDDSAIAEADRVNAILADIFDRRADRWSELGQAFADARGKPWLDAIKGSQSLLDEFANSPLPLWALRFKVWRMQRIDPPVIDRLYDPVPTAAALKAPSYWILAERDSRMPTEWTTEALNKLQRQRKPVDYLLYPDAEHGSLRVEHLPDGQRKVLGYEPDYFKVQIDWLKRNSASRPTTDPGS